MTICSAELASLFVEYKWILLLVTTATTFFSSQCTFQHRESEVLSYFGQLRLFCCELTHFGCTFTGLINAMVYQNGQISGMGGDKQNYVALKDTLVLEGIVGFYISAVG